MTSSIVASAAACGLPAGEVRERVAGLLAREAEAAFLRGATPEQYEAAREIAPGATYHRRSGLVVLARRAGRPGHPAAVISAGTTDMPVAEEAAEAAAAYGLAVERVTDVGVAGLHRLLAARAAFENARVLIAVAGMDGALPSAVARLSARPVVAVPTSVGYGAWLGGVAALAAMLTAGAPGLVATGIDDGLAAAVMARRIVG